jgi:hypothetical protein
LNIPCRFSILTNYSCGWASIDRTRILVDANERYAPKKLARLKVSVWKVNFILICQDTTNWKKNECISYGLKKRVQKPRSSTWRAQNTIQIDVWLAKYNTHVTDASLWLE